MSEWGQQPRDRKLAVAALVKARYLNRDFLLPFTLALAPLLLTWWLLQDARETTQPEDHVTALNADYYITGFTATALNPSGNPQYQLTAERLVHYLYTDNVELTRPVYAKFRAGAGSTEISADTAQATQDHSVLTLKGAVRILSRDAQNRTEVETSTEELTIFPKRDYAETDRPVEIRSRDGLLRGTGLTVNSQVGKLTLMSQVRGTYYPDRRMSQ